MQLGIPAPRHQDDAVGHKREPEGRKRAEDIKMPPKRRQKREKEVELEYEEAILAKTIGEALSAKDDNELFFIDRGGSQSKKNKIQSQIITREKQGSVSLTERRLMEKAQLKMQTSNSPSSSNSKGKETDHSITDIWGADSSTISRKRQRRVEKQSSSSIKGRRSLKILPGHSYNPSLSEHQDALAEVFVQMIVLLL